MDEVAGPVRDDLARERREDPVAFWVFVWFMVAVSLAAFVLLGRLLLEVVLPHYGY